MPPTISIGSIKVAIPLKPDRIPADLVPPEPAPAGSPTLTLQLEGTPLLLTVQLNGKTCRKALKQLAECGVDNASALIQGTLVPGPESGTWAVTGGGLQIFDKRAQAPSDPAK
jgi:hypothetical protein